MENVVKLRDARQEQISRHAFFDWMRSDVVSLSDRLTFAPAGALFIMQFRDMNRWVLRFPEPRSEFEWVINLGTLEDEKHSRMFLQDWRKLDLDNRLGWRAGDVLWWLFLSPDQEVFRRSGIEFMRLAVDDGDDAMIRFGHSEAGEATGHVMLSNTAGVASELSALTGLDYGYFGPYHLELESGHVGNTEGVFETVVLDRDSRERASAACTRMFDIFDGIFDGFLHYAATYLNTGTTPRTELVRSTSSASRSTLSGTRSRTSTSSSASRSSCTSSASARGSAGTGPRGCSRGRWCLARGPCCQPPDFAMPAAALMARCWHRTAHRFVARR